MNKEKIKEYEKQLDLDYVEDNYISKSLVKEILDNKSFIIFGGYSEFPDNARKITAHRYIKVEDLEKLLEDK